MTWLTWRRRRAVLCTAAGLGVLIIGLVAVQEASGPDTFGRVTWGLSRMAVLGLPFVVGALAGAGAFAGELDRGTHVLTLSQRRSRSSWWVTGLAIGAVATVVVMTVSSLVVGAIDASEHRSPLSTPWFESSGITPVAYGLLAFAIAATVGLVTRNALAGAVVAAVVHLVLAFGLTRLPYYLPSESVSAPFAAAATNLDTPPDALVLGMGYLDSAGRKVSVEALYGPSGACSTIEDSPACLRTAGVATVYQNYQPASRYWPFQLVTSGILLVLAALVTAVGTVRLRRGDLG